MRVTMSISLSKGISVTKLVLISKMGRIKRSKLWNQLRLARLNGEERKLYIDSFVCWVLSCLFRKLLLVWLYWA
jgi:hypothetical protein